MNANLVSRACERISLWTGFDLRSISPRRVRDFMVRRSHALGFPSPTAYIQDLENARQTDPEPQRVINLVTNGLTHFWRDEPQLEALRGALRDAGARISDRPVRIWCAGCSTGEEAYTVAMVAREERVNVQVLGTDINTEALGHATLGRYSAWALRHLNDKRRDAHFAPRGQVWEVSDALLDVVEFRRHNVLDRAPDRPLTWDIILCRNVLIYLGMSARERVSENFAVALDKDGYILLGSSEQLEDPLGLFRASRREGGFVYRHAKKVPGTTQAIILELEEDEPPILSARDTNETLEIEDDAPVVRLIQAGLSHLPGDRAAAIACFEAVAGYDPFVVENYIHLGRALADAPERAVEALQKALFLDPLHWYAAAEAGRMYMAIPDKRRATISFRQALEGMEGRTEPLFDDRLVDPSLFHVEQTLDAVRSECQSALETLEAQ